MSEQTTHNYAWADNMRFFATIGVIILHTSANGLYQFNSIEISDWGILAFIDSAMRCCVPLFVMLSGALILKQDKDLFPYLKNRFLRIIVPFLFWSLVYCLAYILGGIKLNTITNITSSSFDILKDILFYKGIFKQQAFHFWYVYMIIGLFIVAPILGRWIKAATEKEILYFLGIWLITTLFESIYLKSYNPNLQLTYFAGYIGYFVLGYYLSIKKFEEKYSGKLLGTITLLSILFTSIITYYLTSIKGSLDEEFFRYLAPNIILLSTTVFIWFKKTKIASPKLNKIISAVNQYSFGIYLVHVLVLRLLKNLGLTWSFIHPLVGITITTLLCFVLSFGIIYVLRKIPGGKYVAG